MIYLKKSFICVILSGGVIKLDFRLFLKMLRLGEFLVCSGIHSNHGQQKARNMYSIDENSYVMFVDLKSFEKGMLTHYQQ